MMQWRPISDALNGQYLHSLLLIQQYIDISTDCKKEFEQSLDLPSGTTKYRS